MSLQQNRRISFSDMNKSLTVTNGNTGIGTTAPSHMLDVNGGMRSINFTTTNALITGITTGTLNASTGITAASAQLTNINATNVVATSISAGTAVATTYTGGSMSLSGNLSIAGTLTTVNITTTNISQTNVSAGTVSATNIAVTTETVGTSRITTSLLALGNSNTVGNVFTTGGNVGIATTSPGSALHVAGAMPISPIGVGVHMGIDSSTYAQIQLNSTIGSYIDFSTSGGDYYSRILGSNNGDIYISTNGGSNNRYVGINTVSPAYTLDVTGTGRFTENVSTSTITVNGTGVNSLAVGANTSANAQGLIVQNSFGSTEIGVAHVVGSYSNNAIAGDSVIRSLTSKNLLLQSGSGNVSVYIAASGNVGIATANPAYTLDVTGTGRFTGSLLALGNSNTVGNIFTTAGNVGIGTTAPSGLLHLNGSALFTSSGNLTCTGDIISFGSLSDRRLKKNIEAIDKNIALDVVSRLRGVTFDWREDIFNESKRNTGDIGFIAQEIEELIPEAVSEYTEINSGEVYKSIKYERLIPYLLVTIQHLLDKV
jgi:hypothetical protein